MFEASAVKWKYFYFNDKGEMSVSDTPPEGKKMLAPLLLSCGVDEVSYQKALQGIAAEGFCACVPENYRTESYKILPDGTFPTSPKEGASQLIDAMKKGYDVIDFTGGTCMEQKLVLVKDYFRNHDLPKQKIKFWGFSNGSSPMLYLSDILQQIHSPSASDIFVGRRTEATQMAVSALRGEVSEVRKRMTCVNQAALDLYQPDRGDERIESEEELLSYTVNTQMLLHNLDSCEEWRPEAGKDFVLCVEGITSLHGFAPYEAIGKLFAKWDELGILSRLKHLELGEIVSFDRENSKTQVEQEKAAIRFLCDQYNIALVTGLEGFRTGHSGYVPVDPCNVPCRIKVGADGVLEQVTQFLDRNPPRLPTPQFPPDNQPLMPPVFPQMPRPRLSKVSYEPVAKIVDRRAGDVIDVDVDSINQSAQAMLKAPLITKVCGGKMYNVIDYRTDPEFGLLLVNDSTNRNSIMLPLQDALLRGRLGKSDLSEGCDVPFVAIVLCGDKTVDPEVRQNFVRDNESYVRKITEEFGVETPIFVVKNQIEISDSLFIGNFRMSRAREVPSVYAATAGSGEVRALAEKQQGRILD